MAVMYAAQIVWFYLFLGGTYIAMVMMAIALMYLTPTYTHAMRRSG